MPKTLRDPNAPKRNTSAYLIYQNEMRETFKLQNPGMTFGQLSKYTSVMYSEMPEDEKNAWLERAEQDKARYLHELSEYVPPPGFDMKGDAISEHAEVPMVKAIKVRGKGARDPGAPKRNMSAYLMYQNTMRQSFRDENPAMTFGQLAKYTSSMYASLTPEEKAKWQEAAQQDKARYERELAQYDPPNGFDSVGTLIEPSPAAKYGKRKKDPNAPKRARGSYVFFTLDERPKIIKEYPEIKFTDIGHAMGERWRALSAEAKAEYEQKANDDKRRFTEETAQYNASLPPAPDPQEVEVASPNVVYAPHPQYQEAQQYAEQYYAQHDAQAASAHQYDPNAAAYAQYYAQHGPTQAGYPPQPTEPTEPPAAEEEPEYHYA